MGENTVADTALLTGVSERTIYRRLQDASFRAELNRLRGQLVDLAIAQLADASLQAITTLRALLHPDEPPSVRLGAARAILDTGIGRADGLAAGADPDPVRPLEIVMDGATPIWLSDRIDTTPIG